ncbi:MAG: ZIP family metal transporter, partial [Cyanobacteria bacterium P01_H01_bin.121]
DLYKDVDYPIASVIAGSGFLLILLLEKVFFPEHEHPGIGQRKAALQIYPYVLMLTLSVHSVITGIALGAEQQIAGASVLFIAVIAHKGSAAFALGTSMLRSGFKPALFNNMIVAFSLMTPVGILAGLILTQMLTGTAEQRFEAVFDAIGSGTFLYIATLDILQDEFTNPQQRRAKYALVALGFAIMAVIAIWM